MVRERPVVGMRPPGMLHADRRRWPADALDEWEERAAMREYHGRMVRDVAEREAEQDVRRMWRRERR